MSNPTINGTWNDVYRVIEALRSHTSVKVGDVIIDHVDDLEIECFEGVVYDAVVVSINHYGYGEEGLCKLQIHINTAKQRAKQIGRNS